MSQAITTSSPPAIAVSADCVDLGVVAKPFAMIDWVDIRLRFESATQPQHLYRAGKLLGFSYFEPCDDLTGEPQGPGTTRTFIARLQNPTSPAAMQQKLEAIASYRAFGAAPEQVGMEVSLLFRLRHPPIDAALHLEELAKLGELLYRNLAHPVSPRHVILHAGRPLETNDRLNNRAHLAAGHSIFIGHRDDPVIQRVYVATTDRMRTDSSGSRTRQPLPSGLWAVKVEAAMKDDDCPIRSLQDWACFSFEDLSQPLFAMRKPVAGAPADQDCPQLSSSPTLGATRRIYPAGTCADVKLNNAIRIALRSLTRRSRTRSGQSRRLQKFGPIGAQIEASRRSAPGAGASAAA